MRIPTWLEFGGAPISPGIFLHVLKEDFDICHLHEPNPFSNLLAHKALILKRKPWVVTYHSDIVFRKGPVYGTSKWIYVNICQKHFILRGAKSIMPTSPQYIKISDILPHFREKCVVVPNGVDIEKHKPKNIKHKGKRIMFLGRLIYYKGLQYLIKAMPQILEKVPDAELIIVGDGPFKKEWQSLAKKLGVDKKVKWLGRVSDDEKLKQYQMCDVFVLPSIYKSEAFGIVLLEAMACGKPTIGTDVSGTVYALEDAGIVVKHSNEKALSDAVIKVLKNKKLDVNALNHWIVTLWAA